VRDVLGHERLEPGLQRANIEVDHLRKGKRRVSEGHAEFRAASLCATHLLDQPGDEGGLVSDCPAPRNANRVWPDHVEYVGEPGLCHATGITVSTPTLKSTEQPDSAYHRDALKALGPANILPVLPELLAALAVEADVEAEAVPAHVRACGKNDDVGLIS